MRPIAEVIADAAGSGASNAWAKTLGANTNPSSVVRAIGGGNARIQRTLGGGGDLWTPANYPTGQVTSSPTFTGGAGRAHVARSTPTVTQRPSFALPSSHVGYSQGPVQVDPAVLRGKAGKRADGSLATTFANAPTHSGTKGWASKKQGKLGALRGVGAGVIMGGMSGYWGGDGTAGDFFGGAIVGGMAGGATVGAASRSLFRRTAIGASKALPVSRKTAQSGIKAARAMEKVENRRALFAGGAFLGGGAFGLMFGGEGRSHRRGFNSHRGNTFSR